MITAEQLKEAKDRVEALNRYLDIDAKKIQLEEEQLRTQAPGFWDDAKKAEEQMKKVKSLEKWIEGYKEVKTLVDELELAFDFYKEEMVTEQEVDEAYAKTIEAVEALELKNMLRQEEDPMSCVLKINSGAGGTESQDWASMLMRMYMRYAEAQGYKVTISNLQDGDEAGIKTVTMEVEGDYAYGYLKSENGVHRLVRVSPYNAQGKRMTSFASVFVTPLVDDTIEVYVKDIDTENHKVSLGYKKAEDNPWEQLKNNYPIGSTFHAPVVSLTKFGAFVRILPGVDGLVHISEISNDRVEKVSDALKVGDMVDVKLLDVDFDKKRISLSMKALLNDDAE